MKMEGVLPFARTLLEKAVKPGDSVVDATVGNGHDTVFLAGLAGENGKVYGFDIQESAINKTRKKLSEQGLASRVELFHTGHENIQESMAGIQVSGAIFNLGYLPGSDKAVVTRPETTIPAVRQLFDML